MNKPYEQNPKSGDQTQPAKGAPPFTRYDSPAQDPKETAQESVHEVTPRPGTARDDVKPPLHAAKGNDEVMSQPPQKQS